jgi:WD40 repeat protein
VDSKTDAELIFTSSLDGTVKLWDLRQKPDTPAKEFRDTSDHDKHKVRRIPVLLVGVVDSVCGSGTSEP